MSSPEAPAVTPAEALTLSAHEIVRKLEAAGWSQAGIARASGVSTTRVQAAGAGCGVRERSYRALVKLLLAVKPDASAAGDRL